MGEEEKDERRGRERHRETEPGKTVSSVFVSSTVGEEKKSFNSD